MIENIRKFRIVIILGLALVVLGLVIGIKDDAFRGGLGGQSILRLNGRTYHQRDYNRYGPAAYELISGLMSAGDFGLYIYMQALGGNAQDEQSTHENFLIHRMILKKAAEDFGIVPDDDAVGDFIRSMGAFSDGGEGFSEDAYRSFIDRRIGRLGLTENDFRELISDYLSFERLREVVGSGLMENETAVARQKALENQQISGKLGMLSIDAFEQAASPTDEKLREYWELQRERYQTPERRKFTYVIINPPVMGDAGEAAAPVEQEETEEEEAPDQEGASDPEDADQENLLEEAGKATEEIAKEKDGEEPKSTEEEKAKEEEAKKAAALAEEKRKKQFEIDQRVEEFSYQLEEAQGAGFEELVGKFGWEVRQADLFPKDAPPKALDSPLRSSSSAARAVDELFAMKLTSDPLSQISQPIPMGEGQWLVARLDEVEEPRDKTFEEAKADAKFDYVKEKAAEEMKAAAEKAITGIEAALKEGKPFEEAAKEAGLQGIKSIEKIGARHQPDPATEPAGLFEAGRHVAPGKLAEAIVTEDRTFVFLVEKREVVKQADPVAGLSEEVRNSAVRNEYAAFNDWLAAQVDAAKVQRLYKQ